MSVANLTAPNNTDLLCNSLSCVDLFAQNQIVNNLTINDLQNDNSLNDFVVWDFDTSELKYRNNTTTTPTFSSPFTVTGTTTATISILCGSMPGGTGILYSNGTNNVRVAFPQPLTDNRVI